MPKFFSDAFNLLTSRLFGRKLLLNSSKIVYMITILHWLSVKTEKSGGSRVTVYGGNEAYRMKLY